MDTVSSKDILGFFLDWLRQHQLAKTEKCLLEEIEYLIPGGGAAALTQNGGMDDESCNSESCDTTENDVDLQILPDKEDQVHYVETTDVELSPGAAEFSAHAVSAEKLALALGLDGPVEGSAIATPPQQHSQTHAPSYNKPAVSHYTAPIAAVAPLQPLTQLSHLRQHSPMYEDEDEWADPDDLGFIRVPAQPADEIYRILDQEDPSRAAYHYLQPSTIEEENYFQPQGAIHHPAAAQGYHPPQYQQQFAQFSTVPYYAVAHQAPDTTDTTTGGENLGGRTSPESRPDSATGSVRSQEDESAEQTAEPKMDALASPSVVSESDCASPSAAADSEPPPNTDAHATSSDSAPAEARAFPLEVAEYPAQPPLYHPPGKPPMFFDSFELKVVYQSNRTGFEEHKDFPIRMHSIIAGRYQVLEFLGSAAFSRAIQCVDLKTGQLVCIKIIRNNKDFFDQSLDEIKLLQYINASGDADENCVLQLYDYFYHKEHLFLVCELLRDNLYEFSKYNRESGDDPYFTLARLQKISRQVLTALRYIHRLNLMHCDLKPENILIKSYSRCEVKVIDFGSSCFTSDHLSSYVQSRCYRAPEVVLGLPYGQKIDLWSLGGILAELYTGRVLFHNDSINAMIARIVAICGNFPPHLLRQARYTHKFFTPRGVLYDRDRQTGQIFYLYPKRTTLPHRLGTTDELFLNFVGSLLQLDPEKRPTAEEALQHPFLFHDYGPIS